MLRRVRVRGREEGRQVEARVMQEQILRKLFFLQVQIPAVLELIFLCSCNF